MMSLAGVALLLLTLPFIITFLGTKNPARRDMTLTAIGAILVSGALQYDAALVFWLWRGTVQGIPVSPVDMMAIALIATRKSGANGLPFRVLLALYAAPILLSVTVSSVPMASLFVVAMLAKMALLFVAVAGELTRPSALRGLILGLSLGLIVEAGYVVYQKIGGAVQATGNAGHQNILGLVVEMAVLPLIAAVLEGERRKIVYAGIVAGLIVIAGGGSRGAMLFLAIGVVTLTILSVARRMTPRKMMVIGGGALIIAVVIVPVGLATLSDRFGGGSVIAQEEQRAAFERGARAMAADHPLGVGANMFVSVNNTEGYAERSGLAWNEATRRAPVHNAYLLARAETGWPGQIMLFLLLTIPPATGVGIAFKARKSHLAGVALGSAVAIGVVAIHSKYEYALATESPQALLFINLAIIAGCVRSLRLERRARRAPAKGTEGDHPKPSQAGAPRQYPVHHPDAPQATARQPI